MRLRFAPSPTGALHIGGARTALFNWLLARNAHGTLVLRIEDTDRERSTPENVQQILDALDWLGIDWDEGPIFQTQRFERHREVLERLLERGDAYRSTATSEDVKAFKQLYGADRGFRGKPEPQGAVRLRVPDEPSATVVHDLVRGETRFEHVHLDDPVIARADGTALYNFAVAIDDLDAGITHVVRGEDHLSNTPKQLLVLQAALAAGIEPAPRSSVSLGSSAAEPALGLSVSLGSSAAEPARGLSAAPGSKKPDAEAPPAGLAAGASGTPGRPLYAHLPLLHGPDGRKLSKRHGAASVQELRAAGYLPGAVRNYLALLGWGAGDDQTVLSTEELVERFTLDRVSRNPARFDEVKLRWLNGVHIRALGVPELTRRLIEYLRLEHPEAARLAQADRERLEAAVRISQEKIHTLADFWPLAGFLFGEVHEDPAAHERWLGDEGTDALRQAREGLAAAPRFDLATIAQVLEGVVEQRRAKPREVYQPLRVSISGGTISPGIFESVELLGREETLRRIDGALNRSSKAADTRPEQH
jgi:glutamyl-tRNA synthetase